MWLTAEGRRLVEQVLGGHQAQYERVVGVLSPEERAVLHRLLTRLGRHCDGLNRTTPNADGRPPDPTGAAICEREP